MIKKEYIQPEAKEVEVKLPTILAGSLNNATTGYSFGGDDSYDDTDENAVDAGAGL